MKDSKITVIFDTDVAKKFAKISKGTKWSDKVITQEALEELYEKYLSDPDKTVVNIMKKWRNLSTEDDEGE